MGLGCWAIGGVAYRDGRPTGYGSVSDEESIRAIHAALDLGITFFDTADVYGAGHSEVVLGRALAGRRDQVVIATKFGNTFDEEKGQLLGQDLSPDYIRRACRASLRRLNTDYIDLYQLHVGSVPEAQVEVILDVLDDLWREGLIRAFGWSTDDAQQAISFALRPGCASIQHGMNVFHYSRGMLTLCETAELACICRKPLAQGLLSGKYSADMQMPPDDIRSSNVAWLVYFEDGKPSAEWLAKLDELRGVLTSGGRSLVQGALAWIWGRSECTIPIPGFRTVAQVEENVAAMQYGPLDKWQLEEIDMVLMREP
jgi:aryl-alcohol dehydrogenase-like predicted oxidoreductase